jgi:hypothetical protein
MSSSQRAVRGNLATRAIEIQLGFGWRGSWRLEEADIHVPEAEVTFLPDVNSREQIRGQCARHLSGVVVLPRPIDVLDVR